MTGQRNNYGKRSRSQSDYDIGGSKRRRLGEDRDPHVPGPDDTVYRYLCPGKKIGSIIGRGGEIVKQLRSVTQAKIKIGETVPGCDERVITIFSSSIETNTFEDSYDKICPAQDALFRVHERLVSDVATEDANNDFRSSQVTVRLLVSSDQIGCIIGKGGQIIQGIRSDTDAQIRVLKNEHLPACAIISDELLQIAGEVSVVRNALFQISNRLHDTPSRSQHLLISSTSQPFPAAGQLEDANAGTPVVGMRPLIDSYWRKGDTAGDLPSFYPPPRDESSAKEFSLRLLCPCSNIGGVIGKGGVIIKQIRQESGAFIKVDSLSAEDDCIITISAKEFFEDHISPTIDAALRLQPRCSEKSEKESAEPSYTTRLLVAKSRIGCLIGKGGSIVSDIRRTSHANIRILSMENLPKVASEDDEMVLIFGELDVARNALLQITARLKANFFEREGALYVLPPSIPYHPVTIDTRPDASKYGLRYSKFHDRSYSYSGGYGGAADLFPSDSYGSYSGSQGGGSNYGAYSGYSTRSGSAGLSGPNQVSYGKHHAY